MQKISNGRLSGIYNNSRRPYSSHEESCIHELAEDLIDARKRIAELEAREEKWREILQPLTNLFWFTDNRGIERCKACGASRVYPHAGWCEVGSLEAMLEEEEGDG